MCIAIASPVGTRLPDRKYLKNCFQNNPDGAGIAFSVGDKVKIKKGFMKWKEFSRELDELEQEYDLTNRGVLLHFRIQTHGGINKECCHPFPLSDKEEDLQETEIETDFAVVHNGIISLTSSTARKEKKMSDTMCYIRDILWNISKLDNWFSNPAAWKLIGNTAESKIACMNTSGEIQMTEGFHKDDDGNYYSNDSYKTVIEKTYYNYQAPMWPAKQSAAYLEKYPLMKIRGGNEKGGDDRLFKQFGDNTAYYMSNCDMYVDAFNNLWKAPNCEGTICTKMEGDEIIDKLTFYARGVALDSRHMQKAFEADCFINFKKNPPVI